MTLLSPEAKSNLFFIGIQSHNTHLGDILKNTKQVNQKML